MPWTLQKPWRTGSFCCTCALTINGNSSVCWQFCFWQFLVFGLTRLLLFSPQTSLACIRTLCLLTCPPLTLIALGIYLSLRGSTRLSLSPCSPRCFKIHRLQHRNNEEGRTDADPAYKNNEPGRILLKSVQQVQPSVPSLYYSYRSPEQMVRPAERLLLCRCWTRITVKLMSGFPEELQTACFQRLKLWTVDECCGLQVLCCPLLQWEDCWLFTLCVFQRLEAHKSLRLKKWSSFVPCFLKIFDYCHVELCAPHVQEFNKVLEKLLVCMNTRSRGGDCTWVQRFWFLT